MTEKQLRKLHQNIVAAVASIKELDFKDETEMVCLFPPDMMRYGLGEEIVFEIIGLYRLPPYAAVRLELAGALKLAVGALSATLPNARVVCSFSRSEVFPV